MYTKTTAATPWGVDARPVEIQLDVRFGVPQTAIVGLPDTAVRESRERVRAAVTNCGFDLPARSVLINLAPADLRKEGSHLDLGIAVALLGGHELLPSDTLEGRMFCGELGLDGQLRPIRGALALADLARQLGVRELLLPAANARLAASLGGVRVIALRTLTEAVAHLLEREVKEPVAASAPACQSASPPDLADVRGQELAKRALEIAAAGGHNLLFIGPPGSGKTMLARRLPSLLPSLTRDESIVVTKIHSLVEQRPFEGLLAHRPFRSPHSSTSSAGLLGGGSLPRPGEVSLAHGGVLFLDELPEFRREALEGLRQPLEDGTVTVVRARAVYEFPARFALLAAMNPCPCGFYGDLRQSCRCTPAQIDRYRRRVSGPLLDRIDLHVEVPAISLDELAATPGECSATVARRVEQARHRQLPRFPRGGSPFNAALDSQGVQEHCTLDAVASDLLARAFERLRLSARGVNRTLRVARTIADLAGCPEIAAPHLAEALQFRSFEGSLSP